MEHLHFVTGKLAEHALRDVLVKLAERRPLSYSVDVLGITVAALMTAPWIAKRISPPPGTHRVILPGYVQGDLSVVEQAAGVPVVLGPRDLRRLPEFLGEKRQAAPELTEYDIEIVAEINHAPSLPVDELVRQALALARDGANVIDLGCTPGSVWTDVATAVRALRERGLRVSIDSLSPDEIAPATAAGAELVLSVNSSNRHVAPDWGATVVVIPDDPATLAGLDETIEYLAARNVPLRIDPILEPIGFGFAASLARYFETRRRYPDAAMLMGIGNLTELTDVDSAGVNVLLLAICQELQIHSVLTTQVINWARTSVRECDRARRLVRHSIEHRVPPKHLLPSLVLLRDPKVATYGEGFFDQLAADLKDPNYRLFAQGDHLHVVTAGLHASDTDPFAIFAQLQSKSNRVIDPGHAFYLGFEMCKALTAITLGKEYRQDEALDWGFLTRAETHHRLERATVTRHAQEQPTSAPTNTPKVPAPQPDLPADES